MVRVKICGLTTLNDIHIVNRYQPDYVGFVFAKSKRQVTPYLAAELVKELSPSIRKVGVFVNEDIDAVNTACNICGLDVVQLHGDETPYYCSQINRPIWKAIRVRTAESLEKIYQYDVDGVLLDTYSPNAFGGTGEVFDWSMAAKLDNHYKMIIAGGLSVDNIKDAIHTAHPFCVDVSSGVEMNGMKNEAKVKDFIKTVRAEENVYV